MNALAPAPAALEPEASSQPTRILNTFIAPTKAFTGLDRKAQWWMAWLLIAVFSLGFIYMVDKKIGWDEITRVEMAKNTKQAARMEQMPPEERERATAMAGKVSRVIGYASPIMALIMFVIIAAVLLATFNFGLGMKIGFNTALAIVIYGSLPGLIHAALAMLSLAVGVNSEGFDIRNPVASNLAVLVDQQHKFLHTFLTAFDVFTIWSIVLMGLGFAIIGKKKTSTCIAVIFVWLLVVKLVAAGMAAM